MFKTQAQKYQTKKIPMLHWQHREQIAYLHLSIRNLVVTDSSAYISYSPKILKSKYFFAMAS